MQALAFNRLGVCNALDEHCVFHLNVVYHSMRAALPQSFEKCRVVGLRVGLWTCRKSQDRTVFQEAPQDHFHPGTSYIDLPTLIPFPRLLAVLGSSCAKPSQASIARTRPRGSARFSWRVPPVRGSLFTILHHLASRKLCNSHTRRTSKPQPPHQPHIVARYP